MLESQVIGFAPLIWLSTIELRNAIRRAKKFIFKIVRHSNYLNLAIRQKNSWRSENASLYFSVIYKLK
jgi:hypothetical protein